MFIQKNSIEKAKREAREDGIEEGLEKGREEGKKLEKIEIAKNLLNAKVDIDTIVISTGLTTKEIENL